LSSFVSDSLFLLVFHSTGVLLVLLRFLPLLLLVIPAVLTTEENQNHFRIVRRKIIAVTIIVLFQLKIDLLLATMKTRREKEIETEGNSRNLASDRLPVDQLRRKEF
jgi:Ca2+/H+ antiporter